MKIISNLKILQHSYIIGHYNPSVRIIDLVSLTTFDVCFNFIQLKSTADDIFFVKLFMTILFTLRVFDRNLLRASRRRNTFCDLF